MVWWRWRVGQPPDSSLGDHEEYRAWTRAPTPFHYRWLLPSVCAIAGASRTDAAWRWAIRLSLVASGPVLALWLRSQGASPMQALTGCGLWVLTPAIWERHSRITYLVDAPALVLALGAVLAGWGPLGVGLALAAGATKEMTPLYAALYAGHPWPLIGLLAVPWWRRGGTPWRYPHLYGTCRELFHRFGARKIRTGFTLQQTLFPWGGAIAGVPDPWTLTAIALAIPPILRSIDTVRLLMPALPLAILAAVLGATPFALTAMLLWSLVLSSQWHA